MGQHPLEGRSRAISRRDFLRRSAATGIALPGIAAILAACGGSASQGAAGGSGGVQLARPDAPVTLPTFAGMTPIADGLKPEAGPLKIYNWNDYIYKKVVNAFQDQTGVQVEYTQFTGMSEAISKIQSGTVDFDVFFPTIENLGKLAAAQLLQPINHSYLPNFQANIWPELQDPFYDKGAVYSTPYLTWKTGIGYRADSVADPATLSNPLDVFWDPKNSGKTGVLDEYRETLAYAMLHLGYADPFNTTDPKVIDAAKADLLKLVPLKVDVAGTDYQRLADDSSWYRLSWSGNMNYTRWYLPKGVPVSVLGYYYPPDGGWEVSNDLMVVSANAKNPVLAHMFMNFLMDVDNGLTNFGYEGFQPPFENVTDAQFMKAGYIPQNLANTLVKRSDFQTGKRILAIDPSADQMWQDAWAEFKAGV